MPSLESLSETQKNKFRRFLPTDAETTKTSFGVLDLDDIVWKKGVQGGPPASYKWSYNPSYPVIRPFIGAITPFITSRGPPCSVLALIPSKGFWSLLRCIFFGKYQHDLANLWYIAPSNFRGFLVHVTLTKSAQPLVLGTLLAVLPSYVWLHR